MERLGSVLTLARVSVLGCRELRATWVTPETWSVEDGDGTPNPRFILVEVRGQHSNSAMQLDQLRRLIQAED